MLPASIFKITLKNKGCNFHSVPSLSINHIRNFFSETRVSRKKLRNKLKFFFY